MSAAKLSTQRYQRAALGAALGALSLFLIKDLSLLDLISYWHSRSPLIWPLMLLGALFWQHRIGQLLLSIALGILSLCWCVVSFTPLTSWLADGLLRDEPPQKADAIFVLSSGLQPDGDLTSAAMSRLLKGLELLQLGFAPRLILSELPSPHKSYQAVAAPLMKNLGLSQELITIGPIDNTHDEAVELGKLFQERGWSTLLVVTTPAHTRRAAAVIEKQGIKVISVSAVETRYDFEGISGYDERLYAFGSVMHERLGLWMYKRRGWIDPEK